MDITGLDIKGKEAYRSCQRIVFGKKSILIDTQDRLDLLNAHIGQFYGKIHGPIKTGLIVDIQDIARIFRSGKVKHRLDLIIPEINESFVHNIILGCAVGKFICDLGSDRIDIRRIHYDR